jgi:amino acid adenylation domain-containing protein
MQINVLEYFEKTVLKHKEKIAIIDNESKLTFNELEKCAKKLCFIINIKMNLINQPIGIFLPKGANSIIAFLGTLYSGNFYIPLDIESPQKRLETIINNLEPKIIITTKKYLEILLLQKFDKNRILLIDEIFNKKITYNNKLILQNIENIIDADPVYTIYTSGSTGTPKGVVISHRGVIDYIDWAVNCFNINSDTIIGNQAPFYFDNSTLDIYLCLATGATLIIIPKYLFIFPVRLLEYIKEKEINFIFWVPSVLTSIANIKLLDKVDVNCLKKILFAGEVIPMKHLNYWRKRLKNSLFANLYGPTEITVDCTYYIVEKDFHDDESLPIGVPCRNSDVFILNKDDKKADKNEKGELCVRGSSLALGYWNNFEKTNEVFTQNPLNKNYPDKIYRTGDIVYKNKEGLIIFVGRKDSQIKHQGYRIELGEIENAVLSISKIDNACVLYHEKDKNIILFYESKKELNTIFIRKELISLLPKYMLPTKYIYFKKLPLNANGKVDRKLLKNSIIPLKG